MRQKGIASGLLEKVCKDAFSEGYEYIEAYPGTGETNSRSYHGPLTMYLKSGFSIYKELNGEVIVRKYL